MILKKLYLKNFLIHKESKIEFSDNGITVFIGENGAGKSSIVEGITYALFGKSNKGNNPDLVRWGTKFSEVHLEFEKDGEEYKIERKIEIKGKTTKTEAVLYKKQKGNYILFYQKNLNKEIPKITGISNKTFLSSVLVKQGDIEGILNLNPKERAKVLEDILDLSVYQLLADIIGDKRRFLEAQFHGIDFSEEKIKEIEEEIKNLKEKIKQNETEEKSLEKEKNRLENELKTLKNQLKELQKEKENNLNIKNKIQTYEKFIKNLKQDIKNIQSELKNIEEKEKILKDLKEKVKKLKELEQLLTAVNQKKTLLLELEPLKEKFNIIKEKEKTLQDLSELSKQFLEKEKKLKELDKKILELQKIEGQLEELQKEKEEIQNQLLETKRKAIEIARQLTGLKKIYRTLELNPLLINEMIKNNGIKIDELSEELEKLNELKGKVKNQGDELRKRIKKIEELKGACPTCERPLEEHTKEEILKELNKEIEEKRKEYKQILEKEKEIKEKLKLEKEIQQLLKQFKEYFDQHQEANNKKIKIDSKIFTANRQLKDLEELKKEKEEIEQFLSQNRENFEKFREAEQFLKKNKIEEIENKIQKLEKKLKDLEKTISKNIDIKKIQKEIESLKEEEKNYYQILEAVKRKERLQKELGQKEKELKNYEQQIKAVKKELKDISTIEENIEKIQKKEEELLNKIKTLEEKINNLKILSAQFKGILEEKEKILKQERKKADQIKDIKEKIEKYKHIETALGPKGIQKVIRDNLLYKLPNLINIIFSAFDFPFKQIKFTENFDILLLAPTFEKEDRYIKIDSISGGQRVALGLALRLAIGKFLSEKTDFMILDEPTIHLDEHRRNDLVDILLSIKSKNIVKQLIVITHDREIEDTADSIYYIENGTVKSID